MHALIIEDEFLIAMMLEDELRELGYTSFDVATREDRAVALAQERRPDLITADERLASGSGVEAARTICASRRVAVVYIVGDPRLIAIPGAVKLAKPFRQEELREAVAAARETLALAA